MISENNFNNSCVLRNFFNNLCSICRYKKMAEPATNPTEQKSENPFENPSKTDFEIEDENFSKQFLDLKRVHDDTILYSIRNTGTITQAEIYAFVFEQTKTYLWHYDAFNLNSNFDGETNFSGYIHDEWRIILILYKLSLKYPEIYIQILDSDGDVLGIEAADEMPEFMDEEFMNEEQEEKGKVGPNDDVESGTDSETGRVWLKNGKLYVGEKPGFKNADICLNNYKFDRLQKIYLTDDKLWRNEIIHLESSKLGVKYIFTLKNHPEILMPALRMWLNRDKLEGKRVVKWLKQDEKLENSKSSKSSKSKMGDLPNKISIEINRCSLAQVWTDVKRNEEKNKTRVSIEDTLKSAVCLYLNSKVPQKREYVDFGITELQEVFEKDLDIPTRRNLLKFYENSVYDFQSPDFEFLTIDDLTEELTTEIAPETDKSWYEIDSESLQKQIEESMAGFGQEMVDDFGDILKMPEDVKNYISERKPVTERVDVDIENVRKHMLRILSTEDYIYDDQDEVIEAIVRGSDEMGGDGLGSDGIGGVSENVALVENLLKSMSSEVGIDEGVSSTLVKSLGVRLPEVSNQEVNN